MVRSTQKTLTTKNGTNNIKKNHNKKNNQCDSSVMNAIKAFSNLDFKVTNFKKKANKSLVNKFRNPLLISPDVLTQNGLKTLNDLIKRNKNKNIWSFKTKNGSSSNKTSLNVLQPFMRMYRNKPRINYTNKSSHLLSSHLSPNFKKFKSKLIDGDNDDDDNDDIKNVDNQHVNKPKNQKKAKRAQRRKQLKQRIKSNTTWKFLNDNHQIDNVKKVSSDNNGEEKNDDDINSVINAERKPKSNSLNKKQIESDSNNLTALFKNDQFDANPLKYTKNLLKQQSKQNNNYNKSKKNGLVNIYKMRRNNKNKHRRNKLSDDELKKELSKQLYLMKKRKQKNIDKKKLKLSSNTQFKKKTKSKHSKNGKFIEKKFARKMTKFEKTNQKNRRWRV